MDQNDSTFRLDSDFVRPYSWIQPKSIEANQPPTFRTLHNLTYPESTCILT